MNSDLYRQLTEATTNASKTLELVAHLALSSGKGLRFADAVRAVRDQLEEAQAAIDDYMEDQLAA